MKLTGFHLAAAIAAVATFAFAPLVRAQFVQGIDTYSGNGTVNWTSVKNAGYAFAFVKATEGVDFVDSKFTQNMTNANAAGVYVGPYHFARPDSLNGVPFTSYDGGAFSPNSSSQTNRDAYLDATSEASDFLDAIKPFYNQQGTTRFLRPVADLELARIPDFNNTALEKTFVSNWIQIFSDAILTSLGVRPFMYVSKFNANTYWTSAITSAHALWLAQYKGNGTASPPTDADTPAWPAWSFWQWSDGTDAIATGSPVPGISGLVDRDVFSGTLAQLDGLRLQLPEPSSGVIIALGSTAALRRRRRQSVAS